MTARNYETTVTRYNYTLTAVTIPLAQALITGLLTASVVTFVVVFLAVLLHWSALIPLGAAFGVFSTVTAWRWIALSWPKPGAIPAPLPEPLPAPVADAPELRVIVTTKAPGNTAEELGQPGDVIETFGLHIAPATLRAIIRSVESGAHQWSYRSLAAIPGVSETQAVRLLDELLTARLLQYRDGQKNHPRGHELTAAGRALARRLAESG